MCQSCIDINKRVERHRELLRSTTDPADIVTMTVFLIDVRHTTRMTELRAKLFGDNFPASAAITVSGFARPEIMLEIQ